MLAIVTLAGCAARTPVRLVQVQDVALPGGGGRFDYQEIDADAGRLILAHMGENEVLVIDTETGSTLARLPGVDTPRGIALAPAENRYFASSRTDQIVAFDSLSLIETWRVSTGKAPDGLAWDGVHRVLGVSAQRDGALTLVADGGRGSMKQVALGTETGNVVFDSARGRFWIASVQATGPDQLISVEPESGAVVDRVGLPGRKGAHGVRLLPTGRSAFVACEGNSVVLRIELPDGAVSSAPVGADPDVIVLDADRDLLFVAAESGDVVVFDVTATQLREVARQHVDDSAHTVAVDPASHRLFFPLARASGPVLRIMKLEAP